MTEYKWMLFYSKTFKSFSLSLSADLKWVRVNELYTVMCTTKSSHLSLKWFITIIMFTILTNMMQIETVSDE